MCLVFGVESYITLHNRLSFETRGEVSRLLEQAKSDPALFDSLVPTKYKGRRLTTELDELCQLLARNSKTCCDIFVKLSLGNWERPTKANSYQEWLAAVIAARFLGSTSENIHTADDVCRQLIQKNATLDLGDVLREVRLQRDIGNDEKLVIFLRVCCPSEAINTKLCSYLCL